MSAPVPQIRPARHRGRSGSILPLLVDHHVHLGLVDASALAGGALGAVVDLGWSPDIVALAGGAPCAVAYAGQFLAAAGGYPSGRSWAPAHSLRPVASPADATEAVGEQLALGASLVKVTLHRGGPVMDEETLRAIVEAAGDLPVVAHAEGVDTVRVALECGVAALAHTPWSEPLDPVLVRACAAAGQRWISTLDIHGHGRPTPEQGRAITHLAQFHEAGGTVLYGTDLGNGPLPLGINPRELALLAVAGLDRDAVVAALVDPWPGVVVDPALCTFVPHPGDEAPDGPVAGVPVDPTVRWLEAARVVPVTEVEEQ